MLTKHSVLACLVQLSNYKLLKVLPVKCVPKSQYRKIKQNYANCVNQCDRNKLTQVYGDRVLFRALDFRRHKVFDNFGRFILFWLTDEMLNWGKYHKSKDTLSDIWRCRWWVVWFGLFNGISTPLLLEIWLIYKYLIIIITTFTMLNIF